MSEQASQQQDSAPLVEVQQISVHDGDAASYGLSIELPTAGATFHDSYSFPLAGALQHARPLMALDLFHAGTRLNRILGAGRGSIGEPDAVRFSWPVNALALPARFEAEVRAVLQDRTQVPLATVSGRRETVDTGFQPVIQPLSITSLGRSGSTVLIRALEQHPEIAASPAFEYETAVSLYWLSVLRDLSQPASYRHQLVNEVATRKGGPEWWRAGQWPLPPPLPDPRLEQIVGRAAVRHLATFCQEQIELVYRGLAERFDSPGAAYYAEKTMAGPVLSLQDELYPDGREIVLIRDFRDQLCSAIDFYGEVRRDERERVLELLDHTRKAALGLLERYRQAEGRVHVLRYEDMVLAPEEAFATLLGYLSLPAEPGVVAAMAGAVKHRDSRSDSHRTVPDAAASIGRWRRDLEPDVVEVAGEELRVPLESFGYS